MIEEPTFPPAGMKAISIRQPWAWAIVTIGKDIENRNWPTRYRGPVLVHASSGCTQREYLAAKEFILEAVDERFKGQGIVFPSWKSIVKGGIIGQVEITDCVEESDSPWFVGRYGFKLANPKHHRFVKCKGTTFFFTPDLG